MHLRLPDALFETLRERADSEGITINAAINRAVIDSLGLTCPTCNGAGVLAPADNENDLGGDQLHSDAHVLSVPANQLEEDPATLVTPGATTTPEQPDVARRT